MTEAKRQLCGMVGIDALAGPSELAIVTDGDVDPELVALDLIAQAEHDPKARTYLITTDEPVIAKVGSAPRAGRRASRPPRDRRRGPRGFARRPRSRPRPRRGDRGRARARAPADAAGRPRGVPRDGLDRRRDLPRRMERGSLRRLRRRLEPRPADIGHGALLLRVARLGLRDGAIGRADDGAAAARHAGAAAAIANAEGLVGHAKAVEARRDRA